MTSAKTKPTPPKGGKLGGAVFPRMTLTEPVACAKRLVSKTHTAPQPVGVIYSGVVQAKHGRGAEKLSALKQYGMLMGSTKDGFSASPFAKQLVAAPEGERLPHLRKAALSPKIFKGLFDTYLGDAISKGKLKQRASELNVHPDVQDLCVEMYTKSLALAGLLTIEGDQVTHVQSVETASETPLVEAPDEQDPMADQQAEPELGNQQQQAEGENVDKEQEAVQQTAQEGRAQTNMNRGGRAVIHVNISVDSSLDTEKLAKQLELLRKFGAL